jgi:KamA family protein
MSTSFDDRGIDEFLKQREQDYLLPIHVSPHYRQLVEEEIKTLQGTFGPLYKVAYPTAERIHVRAPGEVVDFVQDEDNMPPGLEDVAIQKYKDRLLILTTDKCAGHCQYCFRQDVLTEQQSRVLPTLQVRVGRIIRYLRQHPEIQEVIFSGGDPLCVPFEHLEVFLSRIRNETSVPHIRVHTRNVVYAPQTITEPIGRLFRDCRVRLVLHIVHPYELAEESLGAIKRLRSCGVCCYAQFPVLRGINDHPHVLARFLEELDSLHVRPLSLFIPDPIKYSASFRIPLARLFSIVNDLNWHTPAWINSVRLVLDTPIGKVRREDIVDWDEERGLIMFERDGKQIVYPDFPEELDAPGDISTLLWKSAKQAGDCPKICTSSKVPVELFE